MFGVYSWFDLVGSQGNDASCNGWGRKMASIFLYLLLPLAGLIILWIRKEAFTRILICIDGFYVPIAYSAFGRGRTILDWARRRLPLQWSCKSNTLSGGLADFWRDGSLLCTLINSAIPGACANPYRHWKKPPDHAQDVAYKYLGVIRVFTESDLSSALSPYLETKLLNYLFRIRKAILVLEQEKLTQTVISPKFVARGMGLYTAEQSKESEFFIYSKYDNVSFFNIQIIIFGPYSTYCKTTVLEYLAKASKVEEPNKNPESTHASISLRVEMERDRVKIVYVTRNCGIHEISLSCNKEVIMGSPFYINVIKYADVPFKLKDNTLQKSSIQIKPKRLRTKLNNAIYQEVSKNSESNPEKNVTSYVKKENPETIKPTADKNRNHIDKNQELEISKYLKDLSSNDKMPNTPKDKEIKPSPSYPDNFTKENYSCFQQLVDNSFREPCRITRTSPKNSQQKIPQFSSASPICSDHIAPEGYRKLPVKEKRKMFSLEKSSNVNMEKIRTGSSFSINENKEDANGAIEAKESEAEPSKLKEQNAIGDKTIREKKLFWESVFKESKLDKTIPIDNTSVSDGRKFSGTKLKHFSTTRKRSLSDSLNDPQRIRRRSSNRSLDNLDICCEISLEDRAKLYLKNSHIDDVGLAKEFLTVKKDGGTRRNLLGESFSRSTEDIGNPKNLSRLMKTSSRTFRKSAPFFRNLELDRLKTFSNKLAQHAPKINSRGEVDIEFKETDRLCKSVEEFLNFDSNSSKITNLDRNVNEQKHCTYFCSKTKSSATGPFEVLY